MTQTKLKEKITNPILTPQEPLKVLMVAVEVSPFSNVGGLSRVVAYLSKNLKSRGHDVRIIMPKFDFIDEEKYPMKTIEEGFKVPTDDKKKPHLICNIKEHLTEHGIPVYFLENREFYERRTRPYGYSDDPVRWALVSRASLEFIKRNGWIPDIIHSHDWHTGIVPDFLKKTYENQPPFDRIATVFTIHNAMYQGWYINEGLPEMERDDGRSAVASLFSERILKQNFMRRGIMYADVINTVSETYAREILTPEFGNGLETILLEVRSKLFGILNGIDYEEFNPATDKFIPAHYNLSTIKRREINKKKLRKEFGLKNVENTPIIGWVGRLEWQKGADLVAEMISPLLREFDVQFVSVGGGNPEYIKAFEQAAKQYPGWVGIHPLPNFTLPRLVFSGSDMMVFPSRFEPCGIVQMEAMRYGSIPIIRAIGGLADSVENYDPKTDSGTGFVFKEFDRWSLFGQVVRAIETYRREEVWQDLVWRAMAKDFSWEASAEKYEELYHKAIFFREYGPLKARTLAPEMEE